MNGHVYFVYVSFTSIKNLNITRLSEDMFVVGSLWPLSGGTNTLTYKVESHGPLGIVRSYEKRKAWV